MTAEYVRVRIAPAGELDMATAPDEFDPRLLGDAAFAVVDLGAVTFVDAFALNKIVELDGVMAERGGSLAVVGASAPVARTFSLARLDSLL